jgi:hypothetical protein
VGVRLGRAKGRQMPVIHEAAFLGVRVLRSARPVLSCVADVTLSRGGDQGRVVPPTLDSLRSSRPPTGATRARPAGAELLPLPRA